MTEPRLFYPALDALWMAERHGMTFLPEYRRDGIRISIVGESELSFGVLIGAHATCRITMDSTIFYPDPAGLALLEPRYGDEVLLLGRKEKAYGIVCGEGATEEGDVCLDCFPEKYWNNPNLFKRKRVLVIKRGGKAFIQPMREDAA